MIALLKLLNVAKGHHRNSTRALEDAMLPGHESTEPGYVQILKGTWIQAVEPRVGPLLAVLSCEFSRLSTQTPPPFAHSALEEKQLSQVEVSWTLGPTS